MGYTGDKKREYQRRWLDRRRQHYIELWGGRCEMCGSTDDLQFDHIDPAKKAHPVAAMWSRRPDVIEAELRKCQLLCGDCHQAKTMKDMGWGGHNIRRYADGCRCDICRELQAERARRYRARKRQEAEQ